MLLLLALLPVALATEAPDCFYDVNVDLYCGKEKYTGPVEFSVMENYRAIPDRELAFVEMDKATRIFLPKVKTPFECERAHPYFEIGSVCEYDYNMSPYNPIYWFKETRRLFTSKYHGCTEIDYEHRTVSGKPAKIDLQQLINC